MFDLEFLHSFPAGVALLNRFQQQKHSKSSEAADDFYYYYQKMMRSAGPRRVSLPFVGDRLVNEFGTRRRPLWDLHEENVDSPKSLNSPTTETVLELSPPPSSASERRPSINNLSTNSSFFSRNIWPSFRRPSVRRPSAAFSPPHQASSSSADSNHHAPIIYIVPSKSEHFTIPTEGGPMVLQLVLPRQSGGDVVQASLPSCRDSTSTTISEAFSTINGDCSDKPGAIPSTAVVPVTHSSSVALSGISDGGQPTSIGAGDGSPNVRVVRMPPLPTSEEAKRVIFRRQLTTLMSCIYSIFVVMLGGVIYVADTLQPSYAYAEAFTIYLTIVGLAWLGFLQFDIRLYLSLLSKWRKQAKRKSASKDNEAFEKTDTEDEGKSPPDTPSTADEEIQRPPLDAYCFKTGPHSGSFYLKIGAAVFCFGHLIHEGLLLSRQILYFTSSEIYRDQCADFVALVYQTLHPLFSFYQLFMIFKYSNIIINRYNELARFAIMHIIAANLCLWVNTIIRETVDSLQHEANEMVHKYGADNETGSVHGSHSAFSVDEKGYFSAIWNQSEAGLPDLCLSKTILSSFTIHASPYLYPFTIEYSLLQVGIWFIMWYNIGNMEGIEPDSEQHLVCGDEFDEECPADSRFSSNLVIHVDCHSANRGLFAGLFILLATVVSVIIFFVAMTNPEYTKTGVIINNVSDAILLVIMILAVCFAYRQTAILDVNEESDPFLDDFLLFIALPCFFLYAIFNVVAGVAVNTPFNVITSILGVVQVVVQTPFIIDGLRRCSNSYVLRYRKPGRELITFLVVCNLACWILETFEIKSHETHSDKAEYYGSFLWTLLSHITLPLTLFYRFHSSVCLVDMWKSAYEPGDVH